jgi:Transposase
MSRTGVNLPQLRKAIRWNVARRSDKGRPQPPMDKRDFALDKPTHEDIVAVADRSSHRKNLLTFRMRPPATPNWLSSDGLSKRRDAPVRGFEDNTVLTNERESLACGHRHVVPVGLTEAAKPRRTATSSHGPCGHSQVRASALEGVGCRAASSCQRSRPQGPGQEESRWGLRPSLSISQRPCFRSRSRVALGRSPSSADWRGRGCCPSLRSSLRPRCCSRRVGSAHHWARELQQLGHTVRLLPAPDVHRYVRRNKTDRTDARALLEAHRNEEIHPVPVKSVDQQALTALHRLRSTWLATRTARINTLRGLQEQRDPQAAQ